MGEELYDLPEGWVWVKLGEVASFKNGINFKSSQKGQEGILTIDVLNMYSKTTAIETKDLYRVNINVKDDYLLKYGDILFVRSSVKREGVGWASLFTPIFKNGINFKSYQKGQLGILTVDVLNMYSNRLAVDTKELYRVDINIKEDYLLEYGDILFVRSSVKREGVGWTSLFIPISEKVTFCGFIIRARLQNLDISPKFITYYLKTDLAREKIVASSSQVTITNISQNALGNILLPIPTVNEQHYIVSKIDQAFTQIDQLGKTIETNLKRSEKLRQSILKQAFTGQLVPQNPNDEPASKLLERIKAEKAQREAQAKPKKKRRNPPKKTPKKASKPKQLELDLDK